MALVEMLMPKMGESIIEGTVLKWLKNVGDRIEEEESVLEVATDKVDTEIPALQTGILREILAHEGDIVAVGKAVAVIDTEMNGDVEEPQNTSQQLTPASTAPNTSTAAPQSTPALTETETPDKVASTSFSAEGRFYSPLVMNIARQENIPMAELDQVPGTGLEGRVTKKDLFAYLENRKAATASPQNKTAPSTTFATVQAPAQLPEETITPEKTATPVSKPSVSVNGSNEMIEMDRMRKMIAQRMVDSKRISPHVTSFVEADVTNMVNWRNKMKDIYKQREGENLTFTPIFIEAVAKAIRDFPMINVSVEGDTIIKKRDINIGMAVALPTGNLIVPIIRNADQMNLNGLTKKVNDLANRARINKLTPDDLSDGTYTISNVGSFGNIMGTPIINQPQVAILALGAIKKKPAVIETLEGDLIGIRHFMFLSHSYDHRVVDGSLGGMFVKRVADYLEAFDLNTTI